MKVSNIVLNNFKNDSRVLKISKTLVNLGFDVEVLALHNDGLPQEEIVDEIVVKRVSVKSIFVEKSFFSRMLKYIQFIYKSYNFAKNSDYIHCNDLSALPIGVLVKTLRRKRKVKVIYDCHELQTETQGLTRFTKLIKSCLEIVLIHKADVIVTVSDSIATFYKEKYKINKPELVLNCPYYQYVEKSDKFRERFSIEQGQRIFLYQGLLGKGRGLEIILDAFENRQNKDSVLVIMGYGPIEDEISIRTSRMDNAFYHEAVSPLELLSYTSSADVGISFIENSCLNYEYCLPNKVFEYVMAGIPVIVSNLTELGLLIDSNKVGVVAEANDSNSFNDAIDKINSIIVNGESEQLKMFKEKYCWEEQEKVLKKIYES